MQGSVKKKINLIYRKLYEHFGPQHWWPADSPFEMMLGAILTQSTSWKNVEKTIVNLKKRQVLEPAQLNKLTHKRLAALIRPAGYYNIKAKRIKSFLNFIFLTYKGDIRLMRRTPLLELRQQLLAVKGIGPETADSMLLYALKKPIFVVDAYTKRIFSRHRFLSADAPYDETQKLFMQNIYCEVKLYNEYHALLVRLAKEFCLKKEPRCSICPIKEPN